MPSHAATRVLETERLTLRAFEPGDNRSLCSLWERNRDRLRDNFPGAVAQLADRGESADYIQARLADWSASRGFWYGIWERSEGTLIGQLHVKNVNQEVGRAELAYLLDRRSERKGFATEAVRRVVSMCFQELQLHKLFLRTIVGNERSATVAKRCGFVLEGTLRGEFLAAGQRRVDVHYFGLLATDD
jgi:ribosomal-protein-alanine N-acetyltransferase